MKSGIKTSYSIVFFDGVCGLCNRFVDRTLRADRRGALRFAPIQGETAREMLPALPDDPTKWAIAFVDENGAVHESSDAVLEIWKRLGGVHALTAPARLVPRSLREVVYRFVARNRYRWFGKLDACRLPTPDEAERFLP